MLAILRLTQVQCKFFIFKLYHIPWPCLNCIANHREKCLDKINGLLMQVDDVAVTGSSLLTVMDRLALELLPETSNISTDNISKQTVDPLQWVWRGCGCTHPVAILVDKWGCGFHNVELPANLLSAAFLSSA